MVAFQRLRFVGATIGLLVSMLAPGFAFGVTVVVGVYPETYSVYSADVRTPDENTAIAHLDRLINAFERSGLEDYELDIVEIQGFKEMMQALRQGDIAVSGEVHWRLDVLMNRETTLLSFPVVVYNEYEAQMVVTQSLYQQRLAEDFNSEIIGRMTATGSPMRMGLWSVLHEMDPENIVLRHSYREQFDAIRAGEADFSLIPATLQVTEAERGLVRVSEARYPIGSTQHFLVSRNHPDSVLINASLNLGLARQNKD